MKFLKTNIMNCKDEISVSIVINNYNYEQFISYAINSALKQTYSNIEVIVVDDGSTDNSREVIASYGDLIKAIFQPNGKQAAALNTGFAASKGEIIFFLDADDYLFPEAVAKVVTAFESGIGKVHFRLQVVDSKGVNSNNFIPTKTVKLSSGEVWRELIKRSGYVSTPMSGNSYRRTLLTSIFPISDEYKTTADDYLMISTPFYGKVLGIEEPLGAYRIHNSNQWALTSVTGNHFRRFVRHDLQNFTLLKQRAREFDLEIPPDLEMRSFGRLWSRLASLRLESEVHPVASDRSLQLIYWGIRSLWYFSEFSIQKRIIYSFWFLWVGLVPLPLAKLAITWLYAPHLRPKAIDWTLTKIRTLVS